MNDELQEVQEQSEAEETMNTATDEPAEEPSAEAEPAAENDVEAPDDAEESDQGEDSPDEGSAEL